MSKFNYLANSIIPAIQFTEVQNPIIIEKLHKVMQCLFSNYKYK